MDCHTTMTTENDAGSDMPYAVAAHIAIKPGQMEAYLTDLEPVIAWVAGNGGHLMIAGPADGSPDMAMVVMVWNNKAAFTEAHASEDFLALHGALEKHIVEAASDDGNDNDGNDNGPSPPHHMVGFTVAKHSPH